MAKTTATATAIAYQLLIVAILAAAIPITTSQQSPPPVFAPGPDLSTFGPSQPLDCFTYLVNLSDCLTYVEGGSNLTQPEHGCCSELANLVDTQPICLCQLLGNPNSVGIPVDIKRALGLPAVCNVTTPPVSLCAAIGIPVGFLTPSESPGPSAVVGDGPVGASPSPGVPDTGSLAPSPSPINDDNGSPTINLASNQHFFIGLAVILSTYFF